MDERIKDAFDPNTFRSQGHWLIDQLSDYLERAHSGRIDSVLHWKPPAEELFRWKKLVEGNRDLEGWFKELIQNSNHLHHPHFMGHQMSPTLPLAALCDLATAFLNNSCAIYEMGPASTVIERNLIKWLSNKIGFSESADGFFTSGGTLGNLTALLAARRQKSPSDVWKEGIRERLSVLVSEQAHYSISRAAQIMGWGEEGVIKVPTDKTYALDASLLEESLARAKALGRTVIGVIANACSTATGSFDPIDKLSLFAKKHDLWLHVDGAHGASTCFSTKYSHYLTGIENADSLVWDPHKLLFMPSLTTVVLFQDGKHSFESFSQQASYLFQNSAKEEWFNTAHRTLECTRRDTSFRLATALYAFGSELFEDFITRSYDLARSFAAEIRRSSDFELPVEPQSNIVCFRYCPKTSCNRDDLQTQIRSQLIEGGKFYIVQTRLNSTTYLRCTLTNPFTTMADIRSLLQEIRVLGTAMV